MITWYFNRKVGTKIFIAYALAMAMVVLIVGLAVFRFYEARQAFAAIGSQAEAAALTGAAVAEIAQRSQAAAAAALQTGWILIGAMLFTIVIGMICTLWISRSVSRPLELVTRRAEEIAAHELTDLARELDEVARGDLNYSFHVSAQPLDIHTTDETGRLAAAFNQMIASLNDTGRSFTGMMESMKRLIASVARNASDLAGAAAQLADIAQQAGGATDQIAVTIQQVAQGTSQQSDHAYHTSQSIEALGKTIQAIASGAQEQARSIVSAGSVADQFKAAIEEVTCRTKESAVHSSRAADQAQSSAGIVHATIAGMRDIQEKVGV
ncbi:MAG TPA: methyl-accepting chemotaxis protein, partial [Anaerolineaceae bacterium]|nr:methyl-accepting chemotaxis protein [Anaerolineaceae bacterium]